MKTFFWIFATFLVGLMAGMFWPQPSPAGVHDPRQPATATAGTAKTSTLSPGGTAHASDVTLPDPFVAWERLASGAAAITAEGRDDLVKRMAAVDPERTWQLLQASKGGMKLQDAEVIARAWSEKTPEKAAAFGLALKDPLLRPAFLKGALSRWLTLDIRGLHAWLAAQPPGLDLARHLSFTNLFLEWPNPSLSELALLVKIDPPGANFPEEFGKVASRHWFKQKDHAPMTAWLRQMEDPLLRDSAWLHIALGNVTSDPKAAAALLPEVNDLRRRRELSSNVAAHMAVTQPREALAYALTLDHKLARQGAWESAFSTWLNRDPQVAVGAIPQDIPLEWIAYSASRMGELAPVEGIRALQSLPGTEALRASLRLNLVHSWKRQQPTAATRWITSESAAVLTEAERLSLLSPPATARGGQGVATKVINGRSVTYTY